MIIVTGASDNHVLSLQNMMNSFIKFNIEKKNTLIVYNLGILSNRWIQLQRHYNKYSENIKFKIFNYSKYPAWYNIEIEAGQYAWKPAIIFQIYHEYYEEIIVWMDSGNIIYSNLDALEKIIIENGIYSPRSQGYISHWTHSDTIKYMNCEDTIKINRNGACLGFNTKLDLIKGFITQFYNYSCIQKCISPEGSSRKNHRQDQSIFSILYYRYNMNETLDGSKYIGFSIHNDVEK